MPETTFIPTIAPTAPEDPKALLLLPTEPPDAGSGPPEARTVGVHLNAEELTLEGPGMTVETRPGDAGGPPTLFLGRRIPVATESFAPGSEGEPDAYEVTLVVLAGVLRFLRDLRWRAEPGTGPLHVLWDGEGPITAPAIREALAQTTPAAPTPTPAGADELPSQVFEGS